MNVALLDLPWDPNLAVEGSNEYNKLVEEFNEQVGFIFFFTCLIYRFQAASIPGFLLYLFCRWFVAHHVSN